MLFHGLRKDPWPYAHLAPIMRCGPHSDCQAIVSWASTPMAFDATVLRHAGRSRVMLWAPSARDDEGVIHMVHDGPRGSIPRRR